MVEDLKLNTIHNADAEFAELRQKSLDVVPLLAPKAKGTAKRGGIGNFYKILPSFAVRTNLDESCGNIAERRNYPGVIITSRFV